MPYMLPVTYQCTVICPKEVIQYKIQQETAVPGQGRVVFRK